MSLDTIRADFALLDEWEDRYRYVIELGRGLPDFDEAARTEQNKVRGCASQVWLSTKPRRADDGHLVVDFEGDSDAMIVKGLIAILLEMFSGKTPAEILAIDAAAVFAELGLTEHLTPQRSNGLASMVRRVRSDAEALVTTA